MRQKVLLAILAGALLCTACGNTTAPDADRQAEESSESTEEESTESEESTEESTEQTEEDASARLKKANFNNYVEVEYEPADYEEIVDDKPDYSGIYTDNYGTPIPYESCTLIKQTDGTYYCEIGVYRSFTLESTAVYQTDGKLEILPDEYGNSGTIQIDGNTAKITIQYDTGDTEEKEYVAGYPTYPDIKDYVGHYSYTTDDGQEYSIDVVCDEHREVYIDVNSPEDSHYRFYHWPPDCGIYLIDGKLIAEMNEQFYGPDEGIEQFIMNYYGNHYLIIDNTGDTSKVYYKAAKTEIMH